MGPALRVNSPSHPKSGLTEYAELFCTVAENCYKRPTGAPLGLGSLNKAGNNGALGGSYFTAAIFSIDNQISIEPSTNMFSFSTG